MCAATVVYRAPRGTTRRSAPWPTSCRTRSTTPTTTSTSRSTCTSGTSTRAKRDLAIRLRHRHRRARAAALRRAAVEVRLPARSRTRPTSSTKMLGDVPGARRRTSPNADAGSAMPGMLLNRLNPLKGLSDDERKDLIARVPRAAGGLRQPRRAARADGRPGHRQGADVPGERARHRVRVRRRPRRAVRQHPRLQPLDPRGDRVRVPGPHVPAARTSRSPTSTSRCRSSRRCSRPGTPMVQFKSGHAHGGRDNPFGGRSIADPVFDPVWARINEAHGCALPCTSGPPTTRSTAPSGARTPRSPSATSTRSSGSCTGATGRRWSSPRA